MDEYYGIHYIDSSGAKNVISWRYREPAIHWLPRYEESYSEYGEVYIVKSVWEKWNEDE